MSERAWELRGSGWVPARQSGCLIPPAAAGRSQDSPPTQLAFKRMGLLTCRTRTPAPVFLEPWVSWAATLLLKAPKPHLRDLERNTANHKEKTAPTHSCLARFPLCLIMTTSRILFLGELHLPPDKPFLSNILGDLFGK